MTLDTTELRRLHGAWQATEEIHEQAHSAQDAYLEAVVAAAPALLDAADELARVKAVLGSEGAVEIVMQKLWHLQQGVARDAATAALAALRELIGGV